MAEPPFAEVIGDPVAHSRSPAIHGHWLQTTGLAGTYGATPVASAELATFLAERRCRAGWRGCNVTAPHKQAVLPLLDRLGAEVAAVGAVNCITCKNGVLTGHNTDVDGVAYALRNCPLQGRKAVVIGAGGAARAALRVLLDGAVAEVTLLARNPVKARNLADWAPAVVRAIDMAAPEAAMNRATVIVNATPMGMAHAPPMPAALLHAVGGMTRDATAFDMVYEPLRTPFLAAAGAAGSATVDGLAMLIGQARRAFTLFFGAAPSLGDDELRRLPALASAPAPA